jgi:hypothetical protein
MCAQYTIQNGSTVMTGVLREAFLTLEFLQSSGTQCPCADVVSSWDDGGCRQGRRMPLKKCLCSEVESSRKDMVVVMHGGYRCCTKHPEGTRVQIRDASSLRVGSVADNIKETFTTLIVS